MNHILLKKVTSFQRSDKQIHPRFKVGDQIVITVLVKEGKKDRLQAFEGLVIAMKGTLNNRSFLVRKNSGAASIERTFYYNSPLIQRIKIIAHGKVRRAKLYYIRHLQGKAARIKSIQAKKN